MQVRMLLALVLFAVGIPVQCRQTIVPVNKEPRHATKFENELVRILDIEIPPRDSTLFHEHAFDNVCMANS